MKEQLLIILPRSVSEYWMSPRHMRQAIKEKNLALVQQCLSLHPEFVSMNMGLQDTPLHVAVDYGAKKIIKLLLRNGTNVNGKGCFGFHPLHLAGVNGRRDIAELLLKYGAEVDPLTQTLKYTPLFIAAKRGYVDLVKLLLQHGANVNHQCLEGQTALLLACSMNKVEIVKLLLQAGANYSTVNEFGMNALMTSCADSPSCFRTLLEEVADSYFQQAVCK